jgi:hypothetical protein
MRNRSPSGTDPRATTKRASGPGFGRSVGSCALEGSSGSRLEHPGRWWGAGIGAAALVVGPGLRPGSLLNLDLVLTPDLQVPSAAWGLGPELAQRVPLGVLLGWAGAAIGGPTAGKVLMLACVAGAFVGAARVAATSPWLARVGAACVYGLSPWLLTRLVGGQLNVAASAAVLPFVLPHLLHPRRAAEALLAGAALAVAGPAGGALALIGAATLVVFERSRRGLVLAVVVAAPQALWAVPAAITAWAGVELSRSDAFVPDASPAMLPLLGGGGFWRREDQLGHPVVLALGGTALLVLAAFGHRRLPAWRDRAAALAAAGVVLAVSPAIPGARDLLGAVTSTPAGALLRDPHRFLVLYLVWLAPAAAAGAARLAAAVHGERRYVAMSSCAALALVMGGPGLAGAGGRLETVAFPDGWRRVADTVRDEPGTVLALPWHAYLDIGFAGSRRVLNPLPRYLGGDVIASFDPELGAAHQEQVDPRAEGVDELVLAIQRGHPVASQLELRGVRWVALLREVDAGAYSGLARDPGLDLRFADSSVVLYEVRAWRGGVVDDDGVPVSGSAPIRPWLTTPVEGPTTWSRPAQRGWVRGFEPAGSGDGGRLRVPAGGGPIWFWPAVAVVVTDIGVGFAVFVAFTRARRHP